MSGRAPPDAASTRRLRYAQTRWIEFLLATVMLGWGLLLLHPEPILVGPVYGAFARHVSHLNEQRVGGVVFAVALIRLAALWVNGRRRETPLARLVGAQTGFLFWLAVTIGFWEATPPLNTALAVYPAFVVAEICSMWRCGSDIIAADSIGLVRRLRRRGGGNA